MINLVYLTRSVREGLTAIQEAKTLLSRVGMTLKGTDGPPVDLRQRGSKATILGLSIQLGKGQIHYDLTEEAWTNLKQHLSDPNGTAVCGVRVYVDSS